MPRSRSSRKGIPHASRATGNYGRILPATWMISATRQPRHRHKSGAHAKRRGAARDLENGDRAERSRTAGRRLQFTGIIVGITLLALIANVISLQRIDSLDVSVYRCYAQGFWQGEQILHQAATRDCAPLWEKPPQRFHALPREYPAASLVIFSLPLLTPWLSYTNGYIAWMAIILLVATGLLAWRGPPEAAIAFPLYALLAGWSFTLERYDLLPGLCVVLAFALTQRERPRAATAVLAVGTLLKLFPVLLLPLLLIACKRGEGGRWRLDLLAIFAAIGLAGSLPVLLVDPSALWAPIHYELSRPLHIESLPGSLLWLTSNAGLGMGPGLNGGPYPVFSYNSLNVAGGAQAFWGGLFALAGVAGVCAAYGRFWRGRDSLGRAMILVMLVFIASGKVLSPQYFLWILPLAALVEGIRLRWLALSALVCAIITCYYNLPLSTLPWSGPFMSVIVIRNLLLIGLIALYLVLPGDRQLRGWPTQPLWRLVR